MTTIGGSVPDLIPARMLNEFAYCPRLFYLEWVQGEWADSVDTVEGRFRHRRVDQEGGSLPDPDGEEAGEEGTRIHARSIMLSSEQLGAIARIDLIEGEGLHVTPVDYKRGKAPDVEGGAWEPERVQLCLQGLILRDTGYTCDEGYLYFAESHQRVRISFDDDLVSRTTTLLQECRQTAASGSIPPPLEDSPKCPRCSLAGICLPDEVRMLAEPRPEPAEPRRLVPARDDALPVYVQAQGMTVAKHGDRLEIREKGKTVQEVRLLDVSQVCLFGNVQLTTQALKELCDREIPVCYFTYGGWFYAITRGMGHKNIELRRLQFAASEDFKRSAVLARKFVEGKIRNGRTLLRRNASEVPEDTLRELMAMAQRASATEEVSSLLGVEGSAARLYFSHFKQMLRPRSSQEIRFDFSGRNRRPPRDAVNALLSFAYALLTKDFTVTLLAVGFDPHLGFYHAPRYGRPSLALDLMEEFRPLIGDSVVIGVINTGEITAGDFIARGGSVALTPSGRRKFLEAYSRRLDSLITHPIFGYTISYRRVLEVQARLLARYLSGEIPEYPSFLTR